jgi:hypothetical protein
VQKTCNFPEVYIGDVDGKNTLNVFSKYRFDKNKFVTNTAGLVGLRQVFLGRLDNLNITFVGMHAPHGWNNLGDLELAVNNSDGFFDDGDFQDGVIWAGDFNRKVGDFQNQHHGKYGPFSGSHNINTCTYSDQKNKQYRTPSDFILHKRIGVQTQNHIITQDAVGSDHAPVVSVFEIHPKTTSNQVKKTILKKVSNPNNNYTHLRIQPQQHSGFSAHTVTNGQKAIIVDFKAQSEFSYIENKGWIRTMYLSDDLD